MQAQLIPYAEQRRRRCDCCDRVLALAAKLLLLDGRALLGDLELCGFCAGAFEALLGDGESCPRTGVGGRMAFPRQDCPPEDPALVRAAEDDAEFTPPAGADARMAFRSKDPLPEGG